MAHRKFKVRKGYVFVTIDEKGNRIAQPNLKTVDEADKDLRPFIQGQMHKLELVEPAGSAASNAGDSDDDVIDEPSPKPKRNRAAARGRASTRGGKGKGKGKK